MTSGARAPPLTIHSTLLNIASMSGIYLLAQQSVVRIFVWSLLLIGLLIGAFVVVWWIGRKTTAADDASEHTFSLAELRKMRESGQLNEEQYQKLRDAIVGTAKKERSAG